jgi:hypothetical protein
MGSLSVNSSVTDISRLGTFKASLLFLVIYILKDDKKLHFQEGTQSVLIF